MVCGARRRLLEVAADFDDSNGLRTALRILDAYPVPLRAAAALLGVGQAACIAAAANYGTGTPLGVRAKTAGCWARWGCGYSVPFKCCSLGDSMAWICCWLNQESLLANGPGESAFALLRHFISWFSLLVYLPFSEISKTVIQHQALQVPRSTPAVALHCVSV